jgi:hypothetical protein
MFDQGRSGETTRAHDGRARRTRTGSRQGAGEQALWVQAIPPSPRPRPIFPFRP